MANRVVLGNRSGVFGLFVSKPGVNALTAGESGLLLSTLQKNTQIVASGAFNRSSGSQDISWGALGYRPKIVINTQHQASMVYLSDNSARITITSLQTTINNYWLTSNRPTLSSRCEWYAMHPGF